MTTARAPTRTRDPLTPDNTVLLLIDHQVGPLWELEFAVVRRRVAGLATAARLLAVPAILTAVAPDDRGPIIPELTAAVPDAPVVERTSANAWDEPRVRRAVEATGRTRVILAGVAAEGSVAVAALAASAAGYDAYVALDASSQVSRSGMRIAGLRMLQAGVIITDSVPAVVEMLADHPHPRAREVYAALHAPVPGLHGGRAPSARSDAGRRWDGSQVLPPEVTGHRRVV